MSVYPTDWPGEGPIDLAKHDLPHASSTTEWWYVNSHLEIAGGRKYSVFASFFRICKGYDETTKEPLYAHSITWALSDPQTGKYYPLSLVDNDAPRMGKEKLKRGEGTQDPRLRRSLHEILERGNVPYPDQMFKNEVYVNLNKLELDFDGQRYTKLADKTYRLELYHDHFDIGCDITLTLEKPPIRHGDNGVVKGTAGENMFYYFIPRCSIEGEITMKGSRHPITGGHGWYDHEFGAPPPQPKGSTELPVSGKLSAGPAGGDEKKPDMKREDIAWNWISVQFTNGSEITAYALYDRELDNKNVGSFCVYIDPEGNQQTVNEFEFVPHKEWRSTRTFNEYPTQWTLSVPAFGIELEAEGAFEDQEFITLISKPAFWEGRINAKGTLFGEPAEGTGFIERSGFHYIDSLDSFFKAVSKETRKSVSELLPMKPTYEQARDLIADDDRDDLMEGVDPEYVAEYSIHPVREITDRGGKAWRSYAALACCDVVGGDSRDFVHWLAMPELMHVGSLIVDDVQDKSTWRRGGKTVHMIYGDAVAVNAGTACYFMGQKILIKGKKMSDAQKVRIYDYYFQSLRAGHAGQALDLAGPDDIIMKATVETGKIEDLEKAVLAVHRLKTAAPAGALARMGGVAGNGSEEQIEALGHYFESVGLAFQIIDDVLNLRGFKNSLKTRGEDISQGKVTMPTVKAMAHLPQEKRQWLWDTLKSQPQDQNVVSEFIEVLEACGAIQECIDQSGELVESAWNSLQPLIEDSLQSLMLRSFGWYVLERHY